MEEKQGDVVTWCSDVSRLNLLHVWSVPGPTSSTGEGEQSAAITVLVVGMLWLSNSNQFGRPPISKHPPFRVFAIEIMNSTNNRSLPCKYTTCIPSGGVTRTVFYWLVGRRSLLRLYYVSRVLLLMPVFFFRLAVEGSFAFSFVEGVLVKAIREGKWVLLDEINLASAETLQRLSGLLEVRTPYTLF